MELFLDFQMAEHMKSGKQKQCFEKYRYAKFFIFFL